MQHFVKIITGYRTDEHIVIPARDAHKAYYLFLHPNERGIFSNGRPLIGKDIRDIRPDYHTTMGWNPEHRLDADDMNELIRKGTYATLDHILTLAHEVAKVGGLEAMELPLREAVKQFLGNDRTALPERAGVSARLGALKKQKLGRLISNSRRS